MVGLSLLMFSLLLFAGSYLITRQEKKDKMDKKSKGTLYVYLDSNGEWSLYTELETGPDKIALMKHIVLNVEFINGGSKDEY